MSAPFFISSASQKNITPFSKLYRACVLYFGMLLLQPKGAISGGDISSSMQVRVRVWDLPTRLFHWLLVLLILCTWASFEFNDKIGDPELIWHRFNGYAILILVV